MTPQPTATTNAPATPAAPATSQPPAAQQAAAEKPAAPVLTDSEIQLILHDIFVIGLGAAAFFIKNPNTAHRAANVVSILQGLELQPAASGN